MKESIDSSYSRTLAGYQEALRVDPSMSYGDYFRSRYLPLDIGAGAVNEFVQSAEILFNRTAWGRTREGRCAYCGGASHGDRCENCGAPS